jgi:hypothetical protein
MWYKEEAGICLAGLRKTMRQSAARLVMTFGEDSTKLCDLRPRAKYTDRANAVCRRNRECHVVNVTDPYGHIIGFLDRSRYFFFQVAPQLY